jgi:transcriptional regulator with XRE-family HTH domain
VIPIAQSQNHINTFRSKICEWIKFVISGRQIAAARALIGLSQAELAGNSNISVPTLKRMEASGGAATGLANNVAAVRAALEAAGILFIDQNGNGPGVRLRDRQN